MKGEQERRREIKKEEGEQWGTNPKVEQPKGTYTSTVIASSLAKKVENASTAGSNRTCSNGRSREDKHSDGKPSTEGRIFLKEPICYECGQKGEQQLLCMWRF